MRFVFALLLSVVLPLRAAEPAPATVKPDVAITLYALDCGRARFDDLGPFADTGEYDGHPGTLMASCFLIRHPKGTLLWDAGLGDRYATPREGTRLPLFHASVPVTLASQLRALGLDYGRIDYFAFSHGHADHLGNAGALSKATWIVNRRELVWLQQTPAPPRTQPALIAALPAQRIEIDGDHDVFGDGSVRILATPGHTPGHQVLLVRLPRHGAVLLSGDLYHSHDNRVGRRMPVFNANRADTLASFDRMEKIIARSGVRLVIQHSLEDFATLPRVPAGLD